MKSSISVEQKAYAILRMAAGFLFACHGAQKLLGMPGGHAAHAPLYLAAGIIELAGGTLVFLGLLTRLAALIASGEMAVAYFMAHARLALFPIVNGGELAALYCFVFLLIAARGAVAWALDRSGA